MEYKAVISRILEAERSAREITREAREKEARIAADLEKETEAVRAECFAWAERRLAELREETERHKAEELRAQDAVVADAMEKMEQAYRQHGSEWVETLFRETVNQTS